MAIDYALRRFRQYLVGAPKDVVIVTDHNPLLSIFNGSRRGSIRTEKIKIRHQDIRYHLVYQKGSDNTADFLSRHAKPWKYIPKQEKGEANELNRFLYIIHALPVMDALGVKEIAEETAKDQILSKLQKLISAGYSRIPKTDIQLRPFRKILHEITYLANGTLLKDDRIILPTSLHNKAIKLAHLGAHPGQKRLKSRLRSHFYITDLDEQVKRYADDCLRCQAFTDKQTKEPIQPNRVPDKCWEEVSVDLFGPLPSSKHIVVIQDLASRFPVAKIVSSTSGKHVIPVLEDTYNTFGNPEIQKSDNGPPFNSKDMDKFASHRDIQLVKPPPAHPGPNNVETVMKPLGKAMKIGSHSKDSEQSSLNTFLQSFRDTPHPSTGTAPGALMFRDG